jgi:hypothetical protein
MHSLPGYAELRAVVAERALTVQRALGIGTGP